MPRLAEVHPLHLPREPAPPPPMPMPWIPSPEPDATTIPASIYDLGKRCPLSSPQPSSV